MQSYCILYSSFTVSSTEARSTATRAAALGLPSLNYKPGIEQLWN